MRDKKTYIACARLLPYQRLCSECHHRMCALRNTEPVNWIEEHAKQDAQDEQREFAEIDGTLLVQ